MQFVDIQEKLLINNITLQSHQRSQLTYYITKWTSNQKINLTGSDETSKYMTTIAIAIGIVDGAALFPTTIAFPFQNLKHYKLVTCGQTHQHVLSVREANLIKSKCDITML